MMKLNKRFGAYAMTALVAGSLLVAFGAGYSTSDRPSATAEYIIPPKSRIISLPRFLEAASAADSNVGLLDTVTGAVYRLRGTLDNPAVRNTWTKRVEPVEGPTSGLLDIQVVTFDRPAPNRSRVQRRAGDDTVESTRVFLTDEVTGRTWILRPTSSTNGLWKEVKIFR